LPREAFVVVRYFVDEYFDHKGDRIIGNFSFFNRPDRNFTQCRKYSIDYWPSHLGAVRLISGGVA
jgi:hypothetical protein